MEAQDKSTLRTLWLACLLVVIIVAGFALTYFVYGRLGNHVPASIEAIGELWDGAL